GLAERPGRARRGRARARPALELLEGRTVPSTLSVVDLFGPGVLTFVAGDAKANQLSISYDKGSHRYTFTDPAEPISFGPGILDGIGNHPTRVSFGDGDFASINVSLKDLDDGLRVFSLADPLTVSAGEGNDAVRLGDTAGSLDAILSPVSVQGGAGT